MDIVDIFNKGGYEVIIRATQAPRDAYEQVKKYADKVDLVVCSGGDGTLDEVVTGITELKSQVPVGYIPAGSTNDFANSLFVPKNMLEAAAMIMKEEIYRCDVGRFNDKTFAYVAAFGLFTDVSYADKPGSEEYPGTSCLCAGRCKKASGYQILPYESDNRDRCDRG